MAAQTQVKKYLAYWLQLGKRVCLRNGQIVRQPQPVLQGSGYSREFETCWQDVRSPEFGDCYLEGTEQTIDQLLSDEWEIIDCGRCAMPLAVPNAGISSPICPCQNLESWPNSDLPQPRSPVSSAEHLRGIQQRLSEPKP